MRKFNFYSIVQILITGKEGHSRFVSDQGSLDHVFIGQLTEYIIHALFHFFYNPCCLRLPTNSMYIGIFEIYQGYK